VSDRNGIGCVTRELEGALVHGALDGVHFGGAGECARDLGELAIIEAWDVRDAELGRIHERFQHALEVKRERLHGLAIEELRLVDQASHEPCCGFGQLERDVVMSDGIRSRARLEGRPARFDAFASSLLEGNPCLEDGVSTRVALGLELVHDALEWNVAFEIRESDGIASALDQRAQRGVVVKQSPDREVILERADELAHFRRMPSRDGRAQREVALTGVLLEEDLSASQEQGEERSTDPRAEQDELFAESARELDGHRCSAERLHDGPRPIGGKVEDGYALQSSADCLQLAQSRRAFGLLAFPLGEVDEANAARSGLPRGSCDARSVQLDEIVERELERGAIGHDAMCDERELGPGLVVENTSTKQHGVSRGQRFGPDAPVEHQARRFRRVE
jgi:hypothetical protein